MVDKCTYLERVWRVLDGSTTERERCDSDIPAITFVSQDATRLTLPPRKHTAALLESVPEPQTGRSGLRQTALLQKLK